MDLLRRAGYFTIEDSVPRSVGADVLVQSSAGERDWQRDLAQVATPIVVAMARSLKRSPDTQAALDEQSEDRRLADRATSRRRIADLVAKEQTSE